MIVKHLHTPYELLCVLEQPTLEIVVLRPLLTEGPIPLAARLRSPETLNSVGVSWPFEYSNDRLGGFCLAASNC